MSEKKCKYCSMMIPSDAKICPHCRKVQGWTICAKVAMVVIILAVIVVFMAQNGLKQKSQNVQTTSPVQEIQLTEKGPRVMYLAGHSNIETTMRYTHIAEHKMKDLLKLL